MLTTGHQWSAFVKLSNIYVSIKRKRGCSLFLFILLTMYLSYVSQMHKNYQYKGQSSIVVVVL